MVENVHGSFDCWLNFGPVQNWIASGKWNWSAGWPKLRLWFLSSPADSCIMALWLVYYTIPIMKSSVSVQMCMLWLATQLISCEQMQRFVQSVQHKWFKLPADYYFYFYHSPQAVAWKVLRTSSFCMILLTNWMLQVCTVQTDVFHHGQYWESQVALLLYSVLCHAVWHFALLLLCSAMLQNVREQHAPKQTIICSENRCPNSKYRPFFSGCITSCCWCWLCAQWHAGWTDRQSCGTSKWCLKQW